MNTIQKFIIIDDDIFNNTICKMAIKTTLGNVDIITFSDPEEGLAFIQTEFIKSLTPTILFLDINMPSLTGWDFIKQYGTFSEAIKEHLIIYILSSSIDQRDKDKAESNKYIRGFISKPLHVEMIRAVAG